MRLEDLTENETIREGLRHFSDDLENAGVLVLSKEALRQKVPGLGLLHHVSCCLSFPVDAGSGFFCQRDLHEGLVPWILKDFLHNLSAETVTFKPCNDQRLSRSILFVEVMHLVDMVRVDGGQHEQPRWRWWRRSIQRRRTHTCRGEVLVPVQVTFGDVLLNAVE